ncbi:MAG: B12-binding domain-containing radical SAM protein [Desulfobacterales bacterium]|nr:B12-binding domain-containing radical SAM protein [Desulfobacterales bacterium]
MTDILLIQPPVRDFYLTAKRTIPYGLACIAAALRVRGFSVKILDALSTSRSRIIDLPVEMEYLRQFYGRPDRSPFGLFHHYRHFGYSFEHIGRSAGDSGAFLVGISALFTPYFSQVLSVAEAVKRFNPACRIVAGGHHPTAFPELTMEHHAIDFAIRGEGEVSMPLLARALKNGGDIASIPGIVFRKEDGSLHIGEPVFSEDLDRLLPPAADLIDNDFYQRKHKKSAVITASRGCPMKCTYCSLGAGSPLPFRRRSVKSVMDEIGTVVTRYNVRFLDFEDENLSFDKKWFRHLLKEIDRCFNGYGLELRAMNGLLPVTLDDATIHAMQIAGFKTLNLALGSTSLIQLSRFNRPDVRKSFDLALKSAGKYGMDAVGYVIAGAPDQSAEESLDDLIFLAARRVLAGISIFYPAPGSRDYERCRALKILPDTFSLMRSSALPVSHVTSRREAVTLLRLGRILNFMKFLADMENSNTRALRRNGAGTPSDVRTEIGKKLLDMFLIDGRIRGQTPDGAIFEHDVSMRLTHRFIGKLKVIRVRGARSCLDQYRLHHTQLK